LPLYEKDYEKAKDAGGNRTIKSAKAKPSPEGDERRSDERKSYTTPPKFSCF
jgi:hypothetical protein